MPTDPWYLRVMSGAERGIVPAALRKALSIVEPAYSAVVTLRNHEFDRHPERLRCLPRPVISIGNITAGGTGKTPVVRWLAEALRAENKSVAILSRGYKAANGSLGDEQRMLDKLLNRDGQAVPVLLEADPSRHAAGLRALSRRPRIDVFLLDDGFQHRRLARDLDLVLIRATVPFGYGYTLPRGLLREPLSGLARADAFLITHADAVARVELGRIRTVLAEYNPAVPVYLASHAPVAVHSAEGSVPLDQLARSRVMLFSGIGNPASFERDARRLCGSIVATRRFPDHYEYESTAVAALQTEAATAGADLLLTTEKDWVKIAPLMNDGMRLPIWRLDIAIRFEAEDDRRLLEQVKKSTAG